MRSDLESAMAAVITSFSAQRAFSEDPEGFAGDFELTSEERRSLLAMESDLAALTGSFVTKRLNGLRFNAQRTLAMLGPPGQGLLREYVDTFPMTESFADEGLRFGVWMVARMEARNDGSLKGRMIAEMARFEQHRSAAFWDAWSVDEPVAPTQSSRLRLVRGANVGEFEWDLRLLYWRRGIRLTALRPDHCHLLFFHNGRVNGRRCDRLRPDELVLFRRLEADALIDGPSAGGGLDATGMLDVDGTEVEVAEVARPFIERGALTWV